MRYKIGNVFYCTRSEEGFFVPNEYFMSWPDIIRADTLSDIIYEMETLKDQSLSKMPDFVRDALGYGDNS